MLARKLVRPMGLALLLMVLLCAFGFSAQAIESDPIEFTIQVSPTELTEAGDVRVSLRVANTGNADMIDAVTLYDPAGNLVGSFGDSGSIRNSITLVELSETIDQISSSMVYTTSMHRP